MGSFSKWCFGLLIHRCSGHWNVVELYYSPYWLVFCQFCSDIFRELFSRSVWRGKRNNLVISTSIKHKLKRSRVAPVLWYRLSLNWTPKQNYYSELYVFSEYAKFNPSFFFSRVKQAFFLGSVVRGESMDLYSGIKCKSHFTFSPASAWVDIWREKGILKFLFTG